MLNRDKEYLELIRKARWLKLRKRKMNSDPLCEECRQQGKVTVATEVHHIVPVETALDYESKARLMYDYRNLMSLCHHCHMEAHKVMGKGGTKSGARMKNDAKLQNFKEKFL